MSLKISCPQCKTTFVTSDVVPGTRLFCPSCNACLILALQKQKQETGKQKEKKIFSSHDPSVLHEQALIHLGNWLDVSPLEIENVLQKLKDNTAYSLWTLPKGSGNGVREISTPCDSLKEIQRRILDRILYRIPVSNAAHGFVPGRSIVTNARYHLKTASAILNLDLKDAFPSVSAVRVKHIYVRYVKIPLKHLGESVSPSVLDESVEILVHLSTYRDSLPQGGPCSGYLLNLACLTLDKNIYRLLKSWGESYRYTRYADDITISSPTSIPSELQAKIEKIVLNCGFQINPKKSSYWERSKGQSLKVTGLILEKNQVRIPPQKLEVFRATIHQASQLSKEQLTQEKQLEIQSIVAFVKMVYNRLPHRIWKPYKTYLEKHGLLYPKKTSKAYLELYPTS